ncbi:glycosyltransferase [Catenovulum sp. SM1970]|uniref:glycosyltransferase n=1 Tax=Marinifaba aquimaris TaxID=2741323 RepID=UPI001572C3F0|nr:glycosyltransferase [Marinifaba aquimaris]NTS76898.1 glycosyltransferase [Marinifaba aquimaris]
MSEFPLISVYIPSKNRSGLLKRALNSVLSQSYQNIEVIIVDDASTDDTPEVINKIATKDSRVHYFRFDESKGAPAARNFALQHAQGDYVTGLDDDDYFLPDRLKHLMEGYSDNYAFACSGCFWDYGKVKRPIYNTKMIIDLDSQLYCNHASNQVLIKKERLLAVGGYDERFVACQDWELWTRLIIEYGSAIRLDKCDYVIDTHHGAGRISDNPKRVKGYFQFEKKYKKYMEDKHKKALAFQIAEAAGEKISFFSVLTLLNSPVREKVIKYWLRCLFPALADLRLKLKK